MHRRQTLCTLLTKQALLDSKNIHKCELYDLKHKIYCCVLLAKPVTWCFPSKTSWCLGSAIVSRRLVVRSVDLSMSPSPS